MVVFSLLIQAALHFSLVGMIRGLSWWLSVKESSCQCRTCRRHRIDPWVRTIPWGKKWQSTPVFLPGKSHRQRSLAGCSPWGRKESDTTEWLHFHLVNLNSFHWKENSYKAHDLCIIFIKLMYMFLVHLSLPLVLVLSCPALCDLMDSSTRLLCPWEFSRQEYWSGLSFPSPRNFPNPGIELRSPVLQADSLPSEPFTFNGYH